MTPPKSKIELTRPYMPPLSEFVPYLEQIWEQRWLTNTGRYHQELESALASYLRVPYVSLFSNGTLALIAALKSLDLKGEVITTPFTFAATTHAIFWNDLEPVFSDVSPGTLNLDPDRVESAITERTSAILPVHVYGVPCNVDALAKIAARRGLKLVYDAAHAFGVTIDGRPILEFGDLAVLSFHATKLFTTFEGGAVIARDAETKRKLDHWRNFGISDEVTVILPGLNAKMSEVHAAFGLLQLRHIDSILTLRRAAFETYASHLEGIPGISIHPIPPKITWNYAYCPIRVSAPYPLSRDGLFARMRAAGIAARRYFYPLISETAPYRHLSSTRPANLTEATKAAGEILCLPLYADLTPEDQHRIIDLIIHHD